MAKTLTVVLAADVGKFRRDMQSAEGGLSGFAGNLKNLVGPALIGATAAAGAFATKLAVDGVKAAMDDEASLKALAQTLENVGLAHQQPAVEEFISQMERSLGIADDQLRPAYDRLVRSTDSVAEANKALQIALDVSAGTGKDLQTVVEALGKAYDGNTTGLSRLGAGLDRATLSAGDLNQINGELARVFAGQATTSAETFEGQIRRVQTAVDNAAEAFGQGFLKALGDTNDETSDFVKTLQDVEPAINDFGRAVGFLATDAAATFGMAADGVVIFTEAIKKGGDEGDELFKSLFKTNAEVRYLADQIRIANGVMKSQAEAARRQAAAYRQLRLDTLGAADAQGALNEANGAGATRFQILAQLNKSAGWQEYKERLKETTDETVRLGSAVGTLEKPNEKLLNLYDRQKTSLDDLRQQFDDQSTAVDNAKRAIEEYITTLQGKVLGGINLGEAYEAQFDKEGKATGVTFLEGFNQQIEQAQWFGNVLQAIKAQGADQNLLDQIAGLGPGIGGALGQQMLDDGLVPTINDKLNTAVTAARGVGEAMVPEFLLAGQKSAIEMLGATAEQIQDDLPKWAKVGKSIGKPISANIKAEILAGVAEAVAAAQAAGEAARAEAGAREAARQATLTEQQVAANLANLIRKSDARTGRNVAPVLS